MKIETTDAITLKVILEDDLAAIAQMNERLARLQRPLENEQQAAFVAFQLHNLYNALENAFSQISRAFGANVRDESRWHQELLGRMFLDLSPVRPAVLPPAAKPLLRDLCSFRHVFRHSYNYDLDVEKLTALWLRWNEAGPQIITALRSFADALGRQLTREES